MNYIDKITKKDLLEFMQILKYLKFDFDDSKFSLIVNDTIKYHSSNKNKRKDLKVLQELESRWYKSLNSDNIDYSVYDDIYYFADLWVCWKKYSSEYLKAIISDKSMATKSSHGYYNLKSIRQELNVNSILDLGCGIGYTTIAIKEIFGCKVFATNIKESKQWDFCKYIFSNQNDITLFETVDNIDKVDMIFASEYFEHFEEPILHLINIIKKVEPKYIIFANTFTSKSIGHFNNYIHNGVSYSGKDISRLFSKTLKTYGFNKVITNCFNNRPNIYKYIEYLIEL